MKSAVYCMDAITCMMGMPDESVDMVLADLPYGTTACAWDSIIPLDQLWDQLLRITKPAAPIVLTASQPFTSMLVMSNPKLFRCEWIWQKEKGTTYNPQFTDGDPYQHPGRSSAGEVMRDQSVAGATACG